MAKIITDRLDDLLIHVNPEEKTYDQFHPDIVKMYEEKGYNERPNTKKEWEEAGKPPGGWNGIAGGLENFLLKDKENGEVVLEGTLRPVRYLVGQAMRDYVQEIESTTERTLTPEEINERSPNITGSSLLAPVEYKGKYYIMAQIKGGDVLGGGQVHAALVAGGIDEETIGTKNPFLATLKKETLEEMGINLSSLSNHSFAYIVDERELGLMSVGAIANNINLEAALDSYGAYTTRKLQSNGNNVGKLEVGGIALIEIDIENGGLNLDNMVAFLPDEKGLNLVENYKPEGFRPYTLAVHDYLKGKGNIMYVLDKAGIKYEA